MTHIIMYCGNKRHGIKESRMYSKKKKEMPVIYLMYTLYQQCLIGLNNVTLRSKIK